MERRRERLGTKRNYRCTHRIYPNMAAVLFDAELPDSVKEASDLVLKRREQVFWATGAEFVVIAVSFISYDLRRSIVIPVVSTLLLGLAAVGMHGAMVVSQKQTIAHAMFSAAISAAVCVNFCIETLAGVIEQTAHMPPRWLLFLALVLPYFAVLCLAVVSARFSLALGQLQEALDEESDSEMSSEEIEARAESLQGQDICCVCYSAKKDAALVPCGHKSMCLRCSSQMQSRGLACPVCRAPIQSVLRVYDS
eukprot:gb/GFBE01014252.1/.p1 GENE.gb/GFBE01014252.1/~~gb/GFBE01014252.1/.p1  ORF type:complete len:252 (+),score=44.19 gb/GFBE01014252.1/:1-756(+)